MKTKQLQTKSAHWNLVDEGEGNPLLLVHGFPLDHSMWRFQIEEFSKRFRVVAPDLPGFGQSRLIDSGPVSMTSMASQISELLLELGIREPVCFCGLSMGGYIGWQFWRNHSKQLRSLIACDTRALADTPVMARARELSARQVEEQGPQSIVDGLLEKLFARQSLTHHPEIVEQTRNVIGDSNREMVAAAHRAMAARPDVTEWLRQISVPTLVIVGEHDVISTPEEMSTLADSIANSRFVVIAGAGHMAPLEQPIMFNSAVQTFLNEAS